MESDSTKQEVRNKPGVHNRFDRLVAITEIAKPTIIEFAALCIEGRVHDTFIEGHNKSYDLDVHGNRFSFRPKAFEISKEDELIDMQRLMLGLSRLNASVEVEGTWSRKFPTPKVLDDIPSDARITDPIQTIHSQSHLKLGDLQEINYWISKLQHDENSTSRDAAFPIAFPCFSMDSLRHRSGHEVHLYRDQNRQVESHRIDAPNPADEFYEAWMESLKQKPPNSRANSSLRWKRWRLANLLGGIPEKWKPGVFNWVADTAWRLEEYHSTHGREPIAQNMEYYFDDYVIFANEQMEFDLIKI